MIIDDFNVFGALRSIVPDETDPPLVVDTNTVFAFPIAVQGFKTVTGW